MGGKGVLGKKEKRRGGWYTNADYARCLWSSKRAYSGLTGFVDVLESLGL